ncbi:cysteine desulfurase [Amylibacter sp. SFDW26]|uniref:cysteine desulfurase family protein n=1 Tax=Amylibacter sp. SFDW26 TaxID=2652722 RepID=UPI001261BB31|nr:cysteine desulfurase family protein [Amylibacter sp. SFDW26]KAB7615924.1 cysteine desulfurase [Amylibacter sp. SFDW26]
MNRAYMDWNATAPLRPEARAAMIAAMDAVGNPSSVHAEGRVATGIIEKARKQISDAFGANAADIAFTSGATEAAGLGLANTTIEASGIEHDCIAAWTDNSITADANGIVTVKTPNKAALQAANSETGVLQDLPAGLYLSDYVQAFGKTSCAFDWADTTVGLLSAHKVGGPKGVGAFVIKQNVEIAAQIKGGGQEMGRRSGTENVVGIAGFGAAAETAAKDLANGVWDEVAELRDYLENRIAEVASDAIFFGKDVKRLPNTSNFAVAGWKGETQVMQMDLAGYAISAGSACSSGKVKASKVLQAMGYDDITASSAIRISLGPTNTKDEIDGFVSAWGKAYTKYRAKAA